ncbi:hypothetical protein HYC85_000227 [Camellia sinensis]|uniref:PGG domain-containing protein n=1 Tax=Camellia sinensis TaxID=4442 RepID=A0A7J7I4G9_CAMSI|nr:hypothetical protein HYC85_000227 [Camellia sinensis]
MGNMDIGIDKIRHEPWVIIDSDLTKQKIKQSDLYSDNGSCDLPQSKIVDIAIFCLAKSESMIAWDLPKQKIKHNEVYSCRGVSNSSWDLNKQQIKHSDDYSHRGLSNRSSDISPDMCNVGFRNVLLLIATLIATITFQVPFHLLGSTSKEGYIQDSITRRWFVLFSSMVFISSAGVIIFLLHEFPLKPWPHISISALFGSYMLSLKAVSPNEAPALFFVSIPILLVGMWAPTQAQPKT